MKLTTHHPLLIILVTLVVATVTGPVSLEAAEKPNIVLTTRAFAFPTVSLILCALRHGQRS